MHARPDDPLERFEEPHERLFRREFKGSVRPYSGPQVLHEPLAVCFAHVGRLDSDLFDQLARGIVVFVVRRDPRQFIFGGVEGRMNDRPRVGPVRVGDPEVPCASGVPYVCDDIQRLPDGVLPGVVHVDPGADDPPPLLYRSDVGEFWYIRNQPVPGRFGPQVLHKSLSVQRARFEYRFAYVLFAAHRFIEVRTLHRDAVQFGLGRVHKKRRVGERCVVDPDVAEAVVETQGPKGNHSLPFCLFTGKLPLFRRLHDLPDDVFRDVDHRAELVSVRLDDRFGLRRLFVLVGENAPCDVDVAAQVGADAFGLGDSQRLDGGCCVGVDAAEDDSGEDEDGRQQQRPDGQNDSAAELHVPERAVFLSGQSVLFHSSSS